MRKKRVLKAIRKEIKNFDASTYYAEEVKLIEDVLQDNYNSNKLHYDAYQKDWLDKQNEALKLKQDRIASVWQEFISLLNARSGLKLKYPGAHHSDVYVKQLLLNTIDYELMCLTERSWFKHLTFDRVVLLLSTLGSITVNIIQACT